MSSLTDDVSYNTYTDENNKTRRLKLKDMYVKTAYNACCSGHFKTDYVDLCASSLHFMVQEHWIFKYIHQQ